METPQRCKTRTDFGALKTYDFYVQNQVVKLGGVEMTAYTHPLIVGSGKSGIQLCCNLCQSYDTCDTCDGSDLTYQTCK